AVTAYLYNDLTMLDAFHQAQDIARNQQIGVWSIPNYATVDQEHGFNTVVEEKSEQQPVVASTPNATSNQTEYFQNCTDLRKVYPKGVPFGHPAYQGKMDRDKDDYACE
ncbi:MAG: excalibur calcium-binding domain-containing protein, partial [Paenisporosarcina sp.]